MSTEFFVLMEFIIVFAIILLLWFKTVLHSERIARLERQMRPMQMMGAASYAHEVKSDQAGAGYSGGVPRRERGVQSEQG